MGQITTSNQLNHIDNETIMKQIKKPAQLKRPHNDAKELIDAFEKKTKLEFKTKESPKIEESNLLQHSESNETSEMLNERNASLSILNRILQQDLNVSDNEDYTSNGKKSQTSISESAKQK